MDYSEIPGAMAFIRVLKDKGIKTGLVTSSDDAKLEVVFRRMPFDGIFDTVVSANRITQGKPHPMCYLLAAEDVKVHPSDCFVFEDSFAGIQSGNDAGMKVIGLATTHSATTIQDNVIKVITDFSDFTVDDMMAL
jgi:HAD superfamily hydrolase (TIGR01509 family)